MARARYELEQLAQHRKQQLRNARRAGGTKNTARLRRKLQVTHSALDRWKNE